MERAWADELEKERLAGDIAWWGFESIKFKLAPNTTYTPDFLVMRADGCLECHEVKGFWEDDARVKIKWAAKDMPFTFLAIKRQPKKAGGGWEIEQINPGETK